LGQFEKAFEAAERLKDFNVKEGTFEIANIYQDKGDINTAIQQFEKVIEIDTTHSDALYSLLQIYKKRGDYAKMYEIARHFAFVARSEGNYRTLAIVFATVGKFDEGLLILKNALQQAIESSSDRTAVIRVGIANLLMYNEQYEEAETYLLSLINTSQPSQWQRWGHEWLYKTYLYRGRYNQALQTCDILIEIFSQQDLARRIARLHARKGLLYLWGWDDSKKSLNALENAVGLQNGIIDGSGFFGFHYFFLYALNRNYEQAEKLVVNSDIREVIIHSIKGNVLQAEASVDAIKSFEDDAVIIVMYYHLAKCQFEAGRLDQALNSLKKLQSVYDNSGGFRAAYYPKSYYLTGKIYEQKGEKELAIKNYEKLLQLWKNADRDLVDLIDTKARLAKLKGEG